MYQQSMFSEGPFKGAQYLADGLYGNVFTLSGGWVVKYARFRDGTLNYLEWCAAMQKAGKGMLGMPEIDALVHTDEGYMVTMRKYPDTLSEACGDFFGHWPNSAAIPAYVKHAHIGDLIDAYNDYMEAYIGSEGNYTNDMHGGNFMVDYNGVLVLIDPSSGDYLCPDPPSELVLQ